jgi:hypothetical protein
MAYTEANYENAVIENFRDTLGTLRLCPRLSA